MRDILLNILQRYINILDTWDVIKRIKNHPFFALKDKEG
jgi:hypothetical protein